MSAQTLAALAGGLIVFTFTVIYTEIREARQRIRARMGYARLLDDEIEANGRALGRVNEASNSSWEDITSTWLEKPPSEEAWKDVRELLAPLMNPDDFRTLAEHYRLLGVLMDLKANPHLKSDLSVWGVSGDLHDEVPRLRSMLSRYETPSRRERWLGF